MKLHLGCGNNIKDDFINIDKFVVDPRIQNWDILKIPLENEIVDEVLAEHLIEHLNFREEKEFFYEMYRILKPGGQLVLEVPNLEWVLRAFLNAKDDFKEFYQVGALDHYFGNGLKIDNRWSLLTTAIWGNQNGEGQFHKNGYTVQKFQSIAQLLNFRQLETNLGFNKGTQVIIAKFIK